MNLYALQQDDVRDVLALITSQSLTISATGAARVAQLQQLFATLEPTPHGWHGCEECKRRAAVETAELERVRAELELVTAHRESAYAMLREERDRYALLLLEREGARPKRASGFGPLDVVTLELRDRADSVLERVHAFASSSEQESTSNLCDAERMHADEELNNERVCHSTQHTVKA